MTFLLIKLKNQSQRDQLKKNWRKKRKKRQLSILKKFYQKLPITKMKLKTKRKKKLKII